MTEWPGADALAGVFYTGGTTGFPQGVMLSHANLLTSALGSQACGLFPAGSRFLHAAPMFHLADLAAVIGVITMGGTHVIVPAFDPVVVMRAIAQHRVTDTILIYVPAPPMRGLTQLRCALFTWQALRSASMERGPGSRTGKRRPAWRSTPRPPPLC